MFDEQSPMPEGSFLKGVNLVFEAESERLNTAWMTTDGLFAAYLRYVSRFGFFRFGPVTIDVSLVEDIYERTVERRPPGVGGPRAISDECLRFSGVLMQEVRRSGRPRIDELHYLLAFMRFKEGLPERVFSELGVTPEQVEAFAASGLNHGPGLETLYSPEEVAEYLNVHVQTVRTWIRSGRLPARRLAGQRALRIKESDMQALLEPLEEADAATEDDRRR